MINRVFIFLLATLLGLGGTAPPVAANWDANRTRDVLVINGCDEFSMDFFINYSPREGQYIQAGWYRLGPGESTYLRRSGERVRHRDNAAIYLYGENRSRNKVLKGDLGKNFDGKHYKMRQMIRSLRGKDVHLLLLC